MPVIIIPAAGRSSRFSQVKPKPFLTNPNGNLMMRDCLTGIDLDKFEKVYLTILREHFVKHCYNDESFIRKNMRLGSKLEICILDKPTGSQCETVCKTIEQMSINAPILIKDVDNCFDIKEINFNNSGICCMKINDTIKNQGAKSYLKYMIYVGYNTTRFIFRVEDIKEKQIISDTFCVGGYYFKSSEQYMDTYHSLKDNFEGELYTSDIIKSLMVENIFEPIFISNYCDWGTYDDWCSYKSTFKTIFCDIDGCLTQNCGEYTPIGWGEAESLKENVKRIRALVSTGRVQLILTTARKEQYRDITIKQLEKAGIKVGQLIMGLYHCKRYIVNDYSPTNPFPSCVAINLERNNDELNKHI